MIKITRRQETVYILTNCRNIKSLRKKLTVLKSLLAEVRIPETRYIYCSRPHKLTIFKLSKYYVTFRVLQVSCLHRQRINQLLYQAFLM